MWNDALVVTHKPVRSFGCGMITGNCNSNNADSARKLEEHIFCDLPTCAKQSIVRPSAGSSVRAHIETCETCIALRLKIHDSALLSCVLVED